MSETIIKVENVSKLYTLGVLGHQTLQQDFQTWWAKLRGKEDPNAIIGQDKHRSNEKFWALKDVSFSLKEGEIVGIIGRNGAGKSTLLKILSKVTAPTLGNIKIKGRIASLLEVGTGFHPELTGRENVYLNGAILGMTRKEIDKRFDEIVDFSEIEKFIDTPVKRYSSGMYVRLAFSVAAHLNPEILILDEVLAVGDSQFQKKCLKKISMIAKEGRTILFVTHNMALVKNLCNSAVLLSQGSVNFKGNTYEAVEKYLLAINNQEKVSNKEYIAKNDEYNVTLSSISLINSRGDVISALECGGQASIKFLFQSNVKFKNLLMSIGIETFDEVRVGVLHSIISGSELEIDPQKPEILCNIPKVTLFPGKYKISVKVMSDNILLFWLPFVSEIEVEKGDFFGTGKLPDKDWGGYTLLEHNWV